MDLRLVDDPVLTPGEKIIGVPLGEAEGGHVEGVFFGLFLGGMAGPLQDLVQVQIFHRLVQS